MAGESPDSRLGVFSPGVVQVLSELGWAQDCTVQIDEYLRELDSAGFQVNDLARSVLQTFGGYEFHFPEGGVAWIRFGVTEARHTFSPDHLPILETLIEDESPCPVGGGGGYILFACPSGRIALLQEQWFCLFVSENLADMLEAIICNDRSRCREVENVEECRPDW